MPPVSPVCGNEWSPLHLESTDAVRHGPRAVKAVDGLDLDIEEGQTVGLVGESGSGKSVTALSAMKLVDDPGSVVGGEMTLNDPGLAAELAADHAGAVATYPYDLVAACRELAGDLRGDAEVGSMPAELRGIAEDLAARDDPNDLAADLREFADRLDDGDDPDEVGAELDHAVADALDGFIFVEDARVASVPDSDVDPSADPWDVLRNRENGPENVCLEGARIDLTTAPEHVMRDIRGGEMSMIFQDPMTSLNPALTVGEQIAESLRLHRHGGKKKDSWLNGIREALSRGDTDEEIVQETVDILDEVGIPEPEARLDEYPHEFSGGCASASSSPSRSPAARKSSSRTSRPPHWTSPSRPRFSTSSTTSRTSSG